MHFINNHIGTHIDVQKHFFDNGMSITDINPEAWFFESVGLNHTQRFGFGFEEYKMWVKENLVVLAQIEQIDVVNNIEEII